MLSLYIKVTKIQDRPNKIDLEYSHCRTKRIILPYIYEQLFQHIGLKDSMLKQLSKCFGG